MRVLFVNRPDADTRPGGDTVQMHETARALRGLGVEVEERLGPQDEATYRDSDIVHLFNLQTPAFTVVEAEKAKRAGRKLAVSTIFWDFGAESLLAESRTWSRIASITGRKIALSLAQRRVEQVAAADRDQVRTILRLADVALPNSKAEISHLRRILPTLGAVAVIPNGIDVGLFDPTQRFDLPQWGRERGIASKGYVLIVARIDRHKNQAAFCRALEGFPHPVILGGQSEDPAVLAECEASGAIHVGRLTGPELAAAYQHARVHALPSFRETPGLASLEAAAMGCSIVSTQAGSAREYFGDDAHYCDPLSAQSMRSATELAWSTPPAASISDRVRSQYTWQAAAEATLQAYQALL